MHTHIIKIGINIASKLSHCSTTTVTDITAFIFSWKCNMQTALYGIRSRTNKSSVCREPHLSSREVLVKAEVTKPKPLAQREGIKNACVPHELSAGFINHRFIIHHICMITESIVRKILLFINQRH